jgi:hypothetical protein
MRTISRSRFVKGDKQHINDISFVNGDFTYVEGKDAYAVFIESAILTRLGELQYDINRGVPYFSTVFDSRNNLSLFEAYIRKTILDFSFVTQIKELVLSQPNDIHTLTYRAVIETDEGIVSISN